MDGIFISYRRDDSAGYAGRLYDRLAPRFGAERVFMDVEGIELGADFVTAIEEAVGSCRVLIVIIGDEWLQTQDAAGRRRLDDPHDFIRLETVTALQRGIRVVPVLVDGAMMPRADQLPEDLRPLARRQAIEISHKQWEASTAELIRALEPLLSDTPPAESAPIPLPVVAGPPAETIARDRPWRLAAAGVAALVVGAGLWGGLGSRDDEPDPGREQARTDTMMTAQVNAEAGKGGGKPAAGMATAPALARDAAPVVVAAAKPAVVPTPTPPVVTAAAAPPPVSAAAPPPTVVAAAPPPTVAAARPTTTARLEAPSTTVTRPAAAVRPPTTRPPEASPVEAPVAMARPAREAAAVENAGLPRVGESWTYRTSGKWPTSPRRSIVIAVQSVANGVVTDGLRGEGLAADVRRSNGTQATFMNWSEIGTEFSPYLSAYKDLQTLGSLRGFSTPDVQPSWSDWSSEAKVIGPESVTVPAGQFDAQKVEVWSSRRATGGPAMARIEPVRIHYLVWYAPGAKRYVKMQRRVLSASGAESERDIFELVAHR